MSKKKRKTSLYTLFPVQQQNGFILYYACDFSEELGDSVYKGYQCTLTKPEATNLMPRRIEKEELSIDKELSFAIKLYDGKQHPSLYQSYASKIAVLNIEGRDVLIMDFIDGFHIHPYAHHNPKLKQLTFFQAVDIAWQLILGLNHLHYNNTSGPPIVHGDVKGENVKIRINEIEVDRVKKHKIDVFYLDLDYAKPITNRSQVSQGTSEHTAIEVLNGSYSEKSDFFALSPLLLSIFGAKNPLRKIIAFRNSHPDMQGDKLIRKFRDINFCTDGLFEHFEKKPEPFVCNLVKHFIMQMGEKSKSDRPYPNAILEFFTSLRQLCLIEEEFSKDRDIYLLRLCIAAQDKEQLQEKKYQTLFFNLDKNLQDRLITLMNQDQNILLYRTGQECKAPTTLMDQLRKNIAGYLMEKCSSLEKPSFLSSCFFSPITRKDIQWLLSCFEHQDYAGYYSPENKKIRKKLENTNKDLAPLISIVAEGIIKPSISQYHQTFLKEITQFS